jgi:Tol biopolymer transport system component
MELERGTTSRLTLDPSNDIYPVWSPDGTRIVFGSDRGGSGVFNLYQKLANGADQDELVVRSSDDMAPHSWSPDGRYLVYRLGFANQRNTGILSMLGERKPRPFLPRPSVNVSQNAAQISPDGRWIVYTSNESGRFEVYVRSFPVPAGKWQISEGGAVFPRWRGDGKEIFYYAADGRLVAVPIKSQAAIEVGTPVPLFDARMLNGPRTGVGFRGQYVTRDGQRFLLNVPLDGTASSLITVVINWTAGLRK